MISVDLKKNYLLELAALASRRHYVIRNWILHCKCKKFKQFIRNSQQTLRAFATLQIFGKKELNIFSSFLPKIKLKKSPKYESVVNCIDSKLY